MMSSVIFHMRGDQRFMSKDLRSDSPFDTSACAPDLKYAKVHARTIANSCFRSTSLDFANSHSRTGFNTSFKSLEAEPTIPAGQNLARASPPNLMMFPVHDGLHYTTTGGGLLIEGPVEP